MTVLVWITEGTWPVCVDAAKAQPEDDITLLHVAGHDVPGAARGAFAGLLGRHPTRDPGAELERLAATSATDLLDRAALRLGRPCTRLTLVGRPEHEVTAAARNATLLIVARDGDHPGPRSLGHATRFVVDHAPCPVLLLWPTS